MWGQCAKFQIQKNLRNSNPSYRNNRDRNDQSAKASNSKHPKPSPGCTSPLKLLSQGQQGKVFLTDWSVDSSRHSFPVIIKRFIDPDTAKDLYARETLTIIDAYVAYPYAVARLYDSNLQGPEGPELIMEKADCDLDALIRGNCLKDSFKVNNRETSPWMTEKQVSHLFIDLFVAMVSLEKAKIVHGDLSLNNILVKATKSGIPRLLLADFGCASTQEHVKKGNYLSVQGKFAPPEAFGHKYTEKQKLINPEELYKRDIYSLSALVTYLLTPRNQEFPKAKKPSIPSSLTSPLKEILKKVFTATEPSMRPSFLDLSQTLIVPWIDYATKHFDLPAEKANRLKRSLSEAQDRVEGHPRSLSSISPRKRSKNGNNFPPPSYPSTPHGSPYSTPPGSPKLPGASIVVDRRTPQKVA